MSILFLDNGCPQVLGASSSRSEGCTPDNYAHFLTEWRSNYFSPLTGLAFNYARSI
jgi:hypothetical protein